MAAPRSARGKAVWWLVLVLIAGAYLGRASLGTDTWVLLTAANAVALALAVGSLRRTRLPQVMHVGILAVFLLGGLFQLYILSRNVESNPSFIIEQAPLLSWVTSADIAQVHELITLAFVTFCLMVAVLATIPVRPRLPRISDLTDPGRLRSVLIWATVAYLGFTALQFALGFGQSALYNRPLPFRIVAITLFYRQKLYPAFLLLGVWVYDRHKTRLGFYLCVIGTGLVVVSESYISTSRGTLLRFGLPVLFLWLLTGRLTQIRKALVVGGLVAYLISAPLLSELRVTRVLSATGSGTTIVTGSSPSPLSSESLNRELGHLLLRVGGTGSMLFAVQNEDELSVDGIARVYRPSGLTSYFTYEVMGRPLNRAVAESQAPTVIGMGTLIGGATGMVLVLLLTVVGFDVAWRWIAKRLWSWPVALALLGHAALSFFSEGVPMQLYKSFLAIAIAELLYRHVAPRASSDRWLTPANRRLAARLPARADRPTSAVAPAAAQRTTSVGRRGV